MLFFVEVLLLTFLLLMTLLPEFRTSSENTRCTQTRNVTGPELTRFLQIPRAPLDSNAIERGLKHAVLIRKNSLFYRNEVTAYNAGVFMTLAATAVHNNENPLHYFTTLLDNPDAVKANPQAWFPWNYRDLHAPRDG